MRKLLMTSVYIVLNSAISERTVTIGFMTLRGPKTACRAKARNCVAKMSLRMRNRRYPRMPRNGFGSSWKVTPVATGIQCTDRHRPAGGPLNRPYVYVHMMIFVWQMAALKQEFCPRQANAVKTGSVNAEQNGRCSLNSRTSYLASLSQFSIQFFFFASAMEIAPASGGFYW